MFKTNNQLVDSYHKKKLKILKTINYKLLYLFVYLNTVILFDISISYNKRLKNVNRDKIFYYTMYVYMYLKRL